SASFFVTGALNYVAAFNMVGWNFLVPGQYTFGIVCIIFLVFTCLAALWWIAVATPVDTIVAGGGLALASVGVSSLISTGAIDPRPRAAARVARTARARGRRRGAVRAASRGGPGLRPRGARAAVRALLALQRGAAAARARRGRAARAGAGARAARALPRL